MDLSNQAIFQIIQTATLIVAVFVALKSIRYQRDSIKKSKTIDLLMKNLEDKALAQSLETLRQIHDNEDDDVAIYANKKHWNDEKSISIKNILNYYENLSVGVGEDIFDMAMIRTSQKTMIVDIYTQTKPFIDKLREQKQHPCFYVEFEKFIKILNA